MEFLFGMIRFDFFEKNAEPFGMGFDSVTQASVAPSPCLEARFFKSSCNG